MIRPFRRALLATSLLVAAASPALAGNLVFNGGFETGNFAGWSVPPNAPPPNGALFRIGTGGAHSGNHYAGIGSASSQYISQTLPTQAGQDYELSFWLRWYFGMLSEFVTVRWEGQPVLSCRAPGQERSGLISPFRCTRTSPARSLSSARTPSPASSTSTQSVLSPSLPPPPRRCW